MDNKLAKARASQTLTFVDHTMMGNNNMPRAISGLFTGETDYYKYHDLIKVVRKFYKSDPIAGTVINRMADMSITIVRNRKKTKSNSDVVDETTMAYYDALVKELRPVFKAIALEYILHGMAVPEYTLERIRGDELSEKLGRKRYSVPKQIWIRNPDNLELKRRSMGMGRQVFIKIPKEDIELILGKGKRSDGTEDIEAYQFLISNFPDYVAAVNSGKTKFLLEDARPIFRKLTSFEDYPTPFLTNALGALQHKEYLKKMDRSIASRAIEAIRLIKTGDKDYPADDDDIAATELQVTQNSSSGERVFNLFTNHTVTIGWVFPPLEALLNEQKYAEPNADIFLGLGFPRILTVGETLRSNSSDASIASLGPKSTLDDLRDAILAWLEDLYKELADKNGFTRYPEPYFSPITTADYTALVQYAIQALSAGAISKDDVAQLYGTDFDTVADQIETEIERNVPSPSEQMMKKQQDFQAQQTEKGQKFAMEQTDKNQKFEQKNAKNDEKKTTDNSK